MVLPDSGGVSRAPPYSGAHSEPLQNFAYGAVTLSGVPFQVPRLSFRVTLSAMQNGTVSPTTPNVQRLHATNVHSVWALPLSLAATWRITFVFFSKGYLDVSLPPVRHELKARSQDMTPGGFPHSDIHGSSLVWQLPMAYRSLLRPSSPLST